MTNLPRLFNYNDAQVRVIVKDGEPLFLGKDVCEYFGDTHYRRSLSKLDEDEKGVTQIDTPGGKQQMTVVNEPGLYSLLFSMQPAKGNLPPEQYEKRVRQIKVFKRWITHEVIPAIRKTGRYSIDKTKEMRAEAMLRNAKVRESKALEGLATKFRDILNPAAVHSLVAYSANMITGKQILALPEIERTYTAGEIGEELGISANKVGRIANKYGLKTDEYGMSVLSKSPYSDKQVATFVYFPNVVDELKRIVGTPN